MKLISGHVNGVQITSTRLISHYPWTIHGQGAQKPVVRVDNRCVSCSGQARYGRVNWCTNLILIGHCVNICLVWLVVSNIFYFP